MTIPINTIMAAVTPLIITTTWLLIITVITIFHLQVIVQAFKNWLPIYLFTLKMLFVYRPAIFLSPVFLESEMIDSHG